MTTSIKLNRRLTYFLLIGACAALTPLGVVAYLDMDPLLANIIAFLIAFNVSFLDHKYLTFSTLDNQQQLRLPHFFAVAMSALVLNESLYFLLLRYTSLHYLIALTLVLSMVAVYTFILSRFWACR